MADAFHALWLRGGRSAAVGPSFASARPTAHPGTAIGCAFIPGMVAPGVPCAACACGNGLSGAHRGLGLLW